MKTIYKYELLGTPKEQTISMPTGANILKVAWQGSGGVLWAIVDTSNELIERKFVLYYTGVEIPANINKNYIGTFETKAGLIIHTFEII